jgi:hypothetical protein
MLPFFLRVLLATNADRQAHSGEECPHDAGHEVVAVSPQSEGALQKGPLAAPDMAVISTSSAISPAPAYAQPAAVVPAVRTIRPSELLDLLAQQMARRAAEL